MSLSAVKAGLNRARSNIHNPAAPRRRVVLYPAPVPQSEEWQNIEFGLRSSNPWRKGAHFRLASDANAACLRLGIDCHRQQLIDQRKPRLDLCIESGA